MTGGLYQIVNVTYTVGNLGDCSTSKILFALKRVAENNNLPLGAVAQPLRVALTGATKSPPIDTVWNLLGEEKCLKRIEAVLNHGVEKCSE